MTQILAKEFAVKPNPKFQFLRRTVILFIRKYPLTRSVTRPLPERAGFGYPVKAYIRATGARFENQGPTAACQSPCVSRHDNTPMSRRRKYAYPLNTGENNYANSKQINATQGLSGQDPTRGFPKCAGGSRGPGIWFGPENGPTGHTSAANQTYAPE